MQWTIDFLMAAYAVCLALGAAWDIRRRRIPNGVSVLVFTVGIVLAGVSGGFGGVLSGVAAVAITIALGMVPWKAGMLGGGDAKFGAAAAAGFGVRHLPVFFLATALAGALVAVVCYLWSSRPARREMALNLKIATVGVMPAPSLRGGGGRVSVPYGVAFAMAALWIVLFQKGM